MKRILVLFAVMALAGCASLFETPYCGYPKGEERKVVRAELRAVIGFDNGGSEISSKNRDVLKKIAKNAIEENAKIVVYGHASHRTVKKDVLQRILINLKISNERALKTAVVLMDEGISPADINTVALFDSRPLKIENSASAEATNRRAEIYLYWLE